MLKDISNFLQKHEEAFDYFPDGREQAKLPKQWVVNVACTLLGKPFNDWIKEKINNRNEKVAIERDVMISVDPEIAAAFNGSTAVSRKFLNYIFFYLCLHSSSHQRERLSDAPGRSKAPKNYRRDQAGRGGGLHKIKGH